jgi:hypothetical protein
LLADINQELVDFEIENMTAELGGQTVTTVCLLKCSPSFLSWLTTQSAVSQLIAFHSLSCQDTFFFFFFSSTPEHVFKIPLDAIDRRMGKHDN